MKSPPSNDDQKQPEAGAPIVTICCLTYNQMGFIGEALQGFLMQEVNFPLEIIVHDDCSTDDTVRILKTYQARYPGRITTILQQENQRSKGRHVLPLLLERARGRYIAICEGDDYWTSPLKLQRQVDWLEAHPESPLCFHDVKVISADGSIRSRNYCEPKPPSFLTITDLLARNPIPTCSVVYRRAAVPPLPPELWRLPMGDWPTWVLAARSAPVGYIDENWGCYRLHAGGQWSTLTHEKQVANSILFYDAMLCVLEPQHAQLVRRLRKSAMSNLIESLVSRGEWRQARPLVRRYLFSQPGPGRAPEGRHGLFYRILLNLPTPQMETARGSTS